MNLHLLPPWIPIEDEESQAICTHIKGQIPQAHVLFGKTFRPVARMIDASGYVLFILNEDTTQCAVVHVQQIRERQRTRERQFRLGCMASSVFSSVDEWVEKRMIPDQQADSTFGWKSSRHMPSYLFCPAVAIHHATAVRANTRVQKYSVCPRHWYVDATFRCQSCQESFVWTADEQRVWFEEYEFYVDSRPTRCVACRARRRELFSLKREYDRDVAAARRRTAPIADKSRIVSLIDQMQELTGSSQPAVLATRELLLKQIDTAELGSPNKRMDPISEDCTSRNGSS